ncbi:hypothetical protein CKO35_04750 [Ectothiorhodospira shaposhnikovii]|uniref:type II secretion system protein GspM n=1 Tax=Ectothiorhodospira shaposhnikovii TaxID=1054 RepID=UPI001903ACB6|nr:type II secretion system protein GspM [Ectothiorhodospira shaposhnikovii]MBK1672617.1 hypothetical protein [Ectothiorhodospira shaposhnikovii]
MNLAARLRALPPDRQRLLAATLLALPLILLPLLVLGPLVAQHRHYADAIDQGRHRLERTHQALERLPGVQAEVAALEAALKRSGAYIERTAPALAAADLQQIISELAERHGITIGSAQVLSPVEGPHATRVAVRLNLGGDMAALAALLRAVENHQPLLMVQHLSLQPDRRRVRRNAPDQPVVLDIRLEVAALMRAPADG